MENQEQTPGLFELQFDENAKSSVMSMAKWALVIVIMSLAGYVVTIFKYFKQKSELESLSGLSEYEEDSIINTAAATSLITIIISVLIGLLVIYFLYQFASKAKKGMETMSHYDVNVGFANFKNYFLVISILLIIALVFVLFGIIALASMSDRY